MSGYTAGWAARCCCYAGGRDHRSNSGRCNVRQDNVPTEVAAQGRCLPAGVFDPTRLKGELVGVLPGRTETHAKALALTFDGERRDHSKIVRADLAQGFTRYIQAQPEPIQRDAETAIAAWLVNGAKVEYVAA